MIMPNTPDDKTADKAAEPASPVITPTVGAVRETEEPTPSRLRMAWWTLAASDWRAKAAAIALAVACLLTVAAVSQAIWRATNLYGVDGELKEWALSTRDADNDLPATTLLDGEEAADGDADAAGDSTDVNGSQPGASGSTAVDGTGAGADGGQSGSSDGASDNTSDSAGDSGDSGDDRPAKPDNGGATDSDAGRWTGYY